MHRSQLDDLLLEFLGLFAEQAPSFNRNLWDRALKSLLRHKRDQGLKDRMYQHPSGRIATTIEAAPFITSVKLIVRGLYWLHRNEPLGLDTPISAAMGPRDSEFPFLDRMKSHTIANGQFVYAFGIAKDDQKASMWHFQFHGNVLARAFTGSVADDRDHL